MDSHNCDRHVVGGMVKNEGNVEIALAAPYPISYRAITPKRDEVGNLLVPVCLSASHIAYGSIRMEPVFMVLSQSAAIAACLAIDRHDGCVQDVDAATVLERLLRDPLADGSRPDIFVDNRDASSVVVNGEWETVVNPWRAYGPDYLSDRSAGALPKSVRYVPEIVSEGLYDVYLYVPKIPGGSSLLPVTVYDGKESSRTCIRAGEIVVTGQTGGEWVRVGRYRFSAGNRGYVEVSNKGADGTVVADAVLRLIGSCRFGRPVGSGCACGGVSARAVRVRHAESRSVPKRVLLAVADGKHPLSIRGERVCDAPCCRFLRYRASLRLERSYEPMISRIGRSWPR